MKNLPIDYDLYEKEDEGFQERQEQESEDRADDYMDYILNHS